MHSEFYIVPFDFDEWSGNFNLIKMSNDPSNTKSSREIDASSEQSATFCQVSASIKHRTSHDAVLYIELYCKNRRNFYTIRRFCREINDGAFFTLTPLSPTAATSASPSMRDTSSTNNIHSRQPPPPHSQSTPSSRCDTIVHVEAETIVPTIAENTFPHIIWCSFCLWFSDALVCVCCFSSRRCVSQSVIHPGATETLCTHCTLPERTPAR